MGSRAGDGTRLGFMGVEHGGAIDMDDKDDMDSESGIGGRVGMGDWHC